MALCPDLVDPPAGATIEMQWSMWGDDRDAYRACAALNAAKAETINALIRRTP